MFDGFRVGWNRLWAGLCYLDYLYDLNAAKEHRESEYGKNTANYGNDSIRQLKDEERVRLRPAVIFGSDGLDGCAHAAFEILSNAVDEARQGYGKLITLTAFRDGSIQVEDNGRGCPLDWNLREAL